MRSVEELNNLVHNVLMNNENFASSYGQIVNNEAIQNKFEEHVGIKWQYCGIIATYCSLGFRDINPCLRSKHYNCSRYYVNTFTNLLTEAITQLEQMDDQELCRNERHVGKVEAFVWFESHIGATIKHPAFTSTSLNWQPVSERNMFKIKTKTQNSNSRNIIPILEIFQSNRAERENEILFEVNTTFSIDKIDNNVIYLKEINPQVDSLLLTNNYWKFDDERLRNHNELV